MRTSYKNSIMVFVFAIISIFAIKKITAQNDRLAQEHFIKLKTDTTNAVNSVKEIGAVTSAEMYIDSTAFGVCDTCVTSFTNVVQENRELSDSLFKENMILYEKLGLLKILNDSLEKTIKKSRCELIRNKTLLGKR